MKVRAAVTVTALIGAMAATASGAVASATAAGDVACGAVVTTNVRLAHDLTCTGDAITVTTSGVTVDLRGHRVRAGGNGIVVATDNAAPVTIQNGTVSGDQAIVANASVILRRVTVSASRVGLWADGGFLPTLAVVTISDSIFTHNAGAIPALMPNVDLRIDATRFDHNGDAVGFYSPGNGHASIRYSVFVANGTGFSTYQHDGHTLTGNVFSGNTFPIVINQSRDNRLEGNRVSHNVNGLRLYGVQSQRNVVVGNQFIANQTYGAKVGDGFSAVTDATIARNVFRGNGAAGLWVLGRPTADGTMITGNTFDRNGFAPGAIVDEHGAPLDDGLHVDNAGAIGIVTLTGNLAVGNAGFGIEATNVVDGGGNREARNGAGNGFVS